MWRLLQRYVTNNCLPEERRKVERWMDESSENRRLVNDLKQIWKLSPEEEFGVNVEDAWNRFRMHEIDPGPSRKHWKPSSAVNQRMVTVLSTAAAVLLVIFVGVLSSHYLDEQQAGGSQLHDTELKHSTARRGEKARISFSDGTVVVLNAASSLRYPKRFDGANREVYLKGEAYFEVVPGADKPFIVHTKTADVEVLGTKFNVRAWDEETAVDVGVREGKVAVKPASSIRSENSVLLTGGQHVSVVKGKGVTGIENVDIEKHLLWLSGGLYFDNEPFKQVLLQIERKFDVQISVKDTSILDVPFTSTFSDENLENVLKVLSASMKMNYRKKNQEIEFSKP
ncbi:FecR domain-containing protein [Fodinibius sediminis]|nr:FecR domain-containing protein [Fodinibius sediminis]